MIMVFVKIILKITGSYYCVMFPSLFYLESKVDLQKQDLFPLFSDVH